ncbi:MAG TPA: prephenate dehydratase [Bacteroidales bacterium]|nr:prephenate dehydratase [Bacteroidales bacterium]HRT89629.1 prephenate dehydratase [Bacteroidales bacterium]
MRKIAIQGEPGSFHEVAAKNYFGKNIEIIPCATFDQTLAEAKTGRADFAVMAIENARAGSILYNYSLLRESGLKILGEHDLRIKQNLMALPGQTISDIHEIRSHPIALSQCMSFLNNHPGITLIETEDTAGSAREISVKKLKGVAAIASTVAAEIYGLEIIAESIETYRENYTRFLIIGSRSKGLRNGNKASVCFSLNHKPGSLANVLVKLAELNINLSKIQSVPRLNGGWEYMFYLDLEIPETATMELIHGVLGDDTTDLEILGIYKKDETIYES